MTSPFDLPKIPQDPSAPLARETWGPRASRPDSLGDGGWPQAVRALLEGSPTQRPFECPFHVELACERGSIALMCDGAELLLTHPAAASATRRPAFLGELGEALRAPDQPSSETPTEIPTLDPWGQNGMAFARDAAELASLLILADICPDWIGAMPKRGVAPAKARDFHWRGHNAWLSTTMLAFDMAPRPGDDLDAIERMMAEAYSKRFAQAAVLAAAMGPTAVWTILPPHGQLDKRDLWARFLAAREAAAIAHAAPAAPKRSPGARI